MARLTSMLNSRRFLANLHKMRKGSVFIAHPILGLQKCIAFAVHRNVAFV
jgi:hypothetical protein